MKTLYRNFHFFIFCILISIGQAGQKKALYLDPGQPLEKRVSDLVGRMTLEEKVSQFSVRIV